VKTEPTCAELFAQARAYSERLGHPMAVSPEDEKEAAELCTKDAQLREIMLAALRCQEFVERSKPAIARIQGRPPTNDQQLELMRRCTLKGLGELSTCVTAATTPPAIDQCWSDMTPDRLASMSTQRPPEAAIVLRQIATAAETALARDGRFPAVEAPPTPAKSCCEGARSRCATAGAEWSTPAWRTLGVPTENTGFFQYSYKSDGKTVLATAIGDLDCDGVSITWRLEGKVEAGKAVWSMTPPPKNTD
jgi:hypothetical protein